jgi:hypothetical protein
MQKPWKGKEMLIDIAVEKKGELAVLEKSSDVALFYVFVKPACVCLVQALSSFHVLFV